MIVYAAVGGLAALVAAGWTGLAVRLIRRRGSFRFLQPTADPFGPDAPAVVAVVPAHNEEAHIAGTIRHLREQVYPRLRITVIDDQSTDATVAAIEPLLHDPQATTPLRLIRGVERPPGWVGKTWALDQGVRAIDPGEAEWLWFIDADMGLHPRALATAVREAERAGADLVSFLPGATCRTFWQGAIGATLAQILAQLYPLDHVNNPDRPEALAAGGFLLVRRSTYDRAGGHAACRHQIVDDIQLARRIKGEEGRLAVRTAPGLAWTHFYGDFHAIWVGLRKNSYAGMDYLPHKLVFGSIAALVMTWWPWLALIAGTTRGSWPVAVCGGWGIIAQAATSIPVLIFLNLPWLFSLTLPLGVSAYVGIAIAAAWHYHRGRILWKDRTFDAASVQPTTPSE